MGGFRNQGKDTLFMPPLSLTEVAGSQSIMLAGEIDQSEHFITNIYRLIYVTLIKLVLGHILTYIINTILL